MPQGLSDKYGMERLACIPQVQKTEEKRKSLSCFSVYFRNERLQSEMPGMLGKQQRA